MANIFLIFNLFMLIWRASVAKIELKIRISIYWFPLSKRIYSSYERIWGNHLYFLWLIFSFFYIIGNILSLFIGICLQIPQLFKCELIFGSQNFVKYKDIITITNTFDMRFYEKYINIIYLEIFMNIYKY